VNFPFSIFRVIYVGAEAITKTSLPFCSTIAGRFPDSRMSAVVEH
jgi:hypothetical protein